MRVVLDTNVFVSAVLGGRLRVIVDAWRADRFTLVISDAIAREYLDVLKRPKFNLTAREITATTDYLLKTAEFVTPIKAVSAVKDDPTDNKFLEAALAGEVMYVVSGDGHLLNLKAFQGIRIVTAREFIEQLVKLS